MNLGNKTTAALLTVALTDLDSHSASQDRMSLDFDKLAGDRTSRVQLDTMASD
jgi:hypothetical protein